jgi:signal transduction histidine kinase
VNEVEVTLGPYGGGRIALLIGAALLFLYVSGALEGTGDTALLILTVIAVLALVLAPFWMRLVRNLAAERSERIRSQERADLAAHLHDSVLQTLTLVQKRADEAGRDARPPRSANSGQALRPLAGRPHKNLAPP